MSYERQLRYKEKRESAGESRVCVYLSADDVATLKRLCSAMSMTQSAVFSAALNALKKTRESSERTLNNELL